MTDSADLRFLLAIQENGSLVATARALGLTPSAVSQRLQQLEKKLGARLVDRTARSLRFTQEGALLCERGAELIRQLDALSEDLQTRQGGLVGTLKVNAPLGFGRRYIAPVISDFQQEHPDVDIELMLSDAPLTEAAERFGLAQLHQLRGRVGRGTAESVCILLYQAPLSPTAKQRLQTMRETTDGFEIARRDLDIRGPGEFLGARQSGEAMLRFADLNHDAWLVEFAQGAAEQMLARFPEAVEAHLKRWLGEREHYLRV